MRVQKLDPANIDPATIAEAATIIQRGGLVAFPTETVYGLGADATNAAAVAAIFTAKGRPSYNPLIVHVGDVTTALRYVTTWPDSAKHLADAFWPGPLTVVLPRRESIPEIVSAGLGTVGIRIPAHPVALALLKAAGVPIAAPSANRSMQVSPTTAEHVVASLGEAPDLILDGGPVSVGIESTVVDLTTPVPTILRPGMISREDLERVIGRVQTMSASAASGVARPSPGMMDRHYSPRARLMVAHTPDAVDLRQMASRRHAAGEKVVVLSRATLAGDAFAVWRMPHSAAEYARALYATLHRVDEEGYDVVVIEPPPTDAAWDGVRDRLRRAATDATVGSE